ncbi:MAG: hypothetical protein KA129_10105 [Microthrixaceae bacterium]|nr:hypothetical protein [Microthrixaceae bacterium]
MTRLRIFHQYEAGVACDLVGDHEWNAHRPLVHVFRDDELDDLARRINGHVTGAAANDPEDIAAIVGVLRNHGSNQ